MVLLLRPGTAAEDGRERGAFVAVVVDVFVLARPAAAADEDEDRLLLVGLLSPLLDDDDADDDECRWLRLVVVVAGGGAGAKDLVRAKAAAKGVEAPVDSEDRVAEEFLRLAAAETVSRANMEGPRARDGSDASPLLLLCGDPCWGDPDDDEEEGITSLSLSLLLARLCVGRGDRDGDRDDEEGRVNG